MWAIVAEIGIEVGLWALNKWLSDPPGSNLANQLTQQPTTNEGQPIPLVFGRIRVKQPGLVWYSGFQSDTDANNNDAPIYGINMLYVLGMSIGPLVSGPSVTNKLLTIYQGDKAQIAGLGGMVHEESFVTFHDLGGDVPALPAVGTISFWGGSTNQDLSVLKKFDGVTPIDQGPTPLELLAGVPVPDPTIYAGYRNQICVALTGEGDDGTGLHPVGGASFYLGSSPQITPLSFEVLVPSDHFGIGPFPSGGANPASVLYSIMTDAWGKMNLDPALIDPISWGAASVTLFNEGHCMSGAVDQATDAKSILQAICNQINGAIYQDPYTGLIMLKLIRGDYDPTDTVAVPWFQPTDIIEISEYQVGAWADVANLVRVKYNNRSIGYNDATALAQNMASAVLYDVASLTGQPAGKIRVVDVEYPYVCESDLADSLAERDLNILGQPTSRISIVLSRRAHTLRPGSVIQISSPEHGINRVVFRVTKVDLGELGDNKVRIEAVQDPYQNGAAGYTSGGIVTAIPLTPPEPLSIRKLTEAPYWLMTQAVLTGRIASADVQRILALAAPDDDATQFSEMTLTGTGYTTDVPMTSFPLSATVGLFYSKTKAPYDTTTGIQLAGTISSSLATFLARTFTYDDIHTYGRSLILVGDEIMAYESATFGGGVWTLHNIWRSELDTAAHDHAIGERIYWIAPFASGTQFVGKTGWPSLVTSGRATPKRSIFVGSGEDPIDVLGVSLRGSLPARVGDFGVAGELMSGTLGLPIFAAPVGQSGYFKAISAMEEGFSYHWNTRDRKLATISRGDEVAETPSDTDPTTYDVYLQKIGANTVPSAMVDGTAVKANASSLTDENQADALTSAICGYGDLDIIAQTKRVSPGGIHGIPPSVTSINWDSPKVRARAERWRSLLGNVRFDFHGAGTNIGPNWVVESGTPHVGQSTSSITKTATDCYLLGNVGAVCAASQTIDVSGYKPRAMTVLLRWYERSIGGSATVAVDLIALDSGGSVLATVSQAATAAPTAVWDPRTLSLTCSANTAKLKVKVTIDSTLGSPGAATEFRLQLGTFNDNVLTNPSFESGTTGWTVDTGLIATPTAVASPSATYAIGGLAPDSQMHQDYALPTGWEVGATAVLECWRVQTLSGDTGKVTLQVLDGSNVVISSVDTTAENLSPLNIWNKRRLSLEISGAAAKLRVIFNAHRSAGSGNSGAGIDEVYLQVHKHLTDPAYYRELRFDVPTVQPVAATWQEWHLEHADLYATGIADPAVFAGGQISAKTTPNSSLSMQWSDGAAHATQLGEPLVGQFGNGIGKLSSYRFARQSGVGALSWISGIEGTQRFANPSSAQAFTAIVAFRIDETGFSTACGLVGRRDAAGGWGLFVDASGHVRAILQGSLGSKLVARAGSTVHDGAFHLAAIVYDPVGHTLTVYDERGNNSTSTASGLGEIVGTAAPFCVGRDINTVDTIPGIISRVYWFDGVALSSGQIAAHWNYAKDPTAALTSYTKSLESWIPGALVSDGSLGSAAGASDQTLVKLATDQVALGYAAALTADGGTGWGLGVSKGSTNIVPSSDFTNGTVWIPDSTVVLTQGIVDATGKRKGVSVAGNSTHGLDMRTVTIGAGANMALSFFGRCLTGPASVDIILLNSSAVVKQTITKSFGPTWQRIDVQFTAWDASTATAIVKFRPTSGSLTYDLTHIMWAAAATDFAAIWPEPGATLSDVTALLSESLTTQANAEGEVIATGVATQASPSTLSIAKIDNPGNGDKNARELLIGASQVPKLGHYDSAAGLVSSSGTALTWNQLWQLRGRWCSIKTLDNASNAFAGIVVDVGSATSAVYGRSATWTYDATVDNRVRIGVGTQAAFNGYLRRLVQRTREEKLV